MKTFLLVFVLLIVETISIDGQVVQLTSNNISQYLQKHVTFVKFYANWCPHSKRFEPIWNDFAASREKLDLRVAKVDCSKEDSLCSDHDIFGYPTVKLFIDGSGARYEGPRDVQSLEKFYRDTLSKEKMEISSGKSVVELNEENFAERLKKNFAFVMFFAPWCSHCRVLKPTFEDLSKEMSKIESLSFGSVDCTKENLICSRHKIQAYPTLIWFENGEEKIRYTGNRDIDSMKSFIEEKIEASSRSAPIVETKPILNVENDEKLDKVLNVGSFGRTTSFEGYAFVNFGAPWCSHCQKLLPVWKDLSRKFQKIDEIRIARVDCTQSEALCRDFGIRAFPTLILFRYGESKLEYNGPRDLESLYNFIVAQLQSFGDEYLLESALQ